MFEGLESIRHVREVLFLDPRPIDKIFSTILTAAFRVFRQAFRFAEAMKVVGAIRRVAAEFEWLKNFLLLLHGLPLVLDRLRQNCSFFGVQNL